MLAEYFVNIYRDIGGSVRTERCVALSSNVFETVSIDFSKPRKLFYQFQNLPRKTVLGIEYYQQGLSVITIAGDELDEFNTLLSYESEPDKLQEVNRCHMFGVCQQKR